MGLSQSNISQVENGHIVPTLETLQRFAKALDIPLYKLFYPAEQRPPTAHLKALGSAEKLAQESGKGAREARFLLKLRPLLARIPVKDRGLFLSFAKGLATR